MNTFFISVGVIDQQTFESINILQESKLRRPISNLNFAIESKQSLLH